MRAFARVEVICACARAVRSSPRRHSIPRATAAATAATAAMTIAAGTAAASTAVSAEGNQDAQPLPAASRPSTSRKGGAEGWGSGAEGGGGAVSGAEGGLVADLARWRSLAAAVGATAAKLGEAFLAATDRFPLTLNLACLARATPDAPSGRAEGPAAPRELVARARHLMRFADAAYGSVLMSALGTYQGSLPPAGVVARGVEATERWCVASHLGIDEADVKESHLVGGSLDLPSYYVAVDHSSRSVVLAVRGTSTLEDVLVDLVADSKPLGGVGLPWPLPPRLPFDPDEPHGHVGMAAHADRLDTAVTPLLKRLRAEHAGYKLVLTGHSMGAGVASLLALRMATRLEPADEALVFACPPVAARVPWLTRRLANVHAIVVADDVVPHLSLASVEGLLRRLAVIDSCEVGGTTRLSIAAGLEPPTEGMVRAATAADAPQHLPLEVPATRLVHLRRAGESDDASGEERARLVNVERFTARLDLAPSCAVDHLQPSYQRALDAAVEGGHV